jgi:hypothetical protein
MQPSTGKMDEASARRIVKLKKLFFKLCHGIWLAWLAYLLYMAVSQVWTAQMNLSYWRGVDDERARCYIAHGKRLQSEDSIAHRRMVMKPAINVRIPKP